MTAISCQKVTISMGGRVVLREIDLEIGARELIGVLGPNGAGKTTLLRAILGLVPIRGGVLQVFGAAPTAGNAAIGYMPQSRVTTDGGKLRGRDIIAATARGERWGLPWPDLATRRQIDWALDRVGARDMARRPLAAMSGGERQRLMLAQSLIGQPKLLLLDEPLVNLDPRHQGEIVALVRELQQDLKITALFSTHELNPLLGAMDRVLYLGGGQAALGSIDSVINDKVLSRLYGAQIEVIRHRGRYFVMLGNQELDLCNHDDLEHGRHAPV